MRLRSYNNISANSMARFQYCCIMQSVCILESAELYAFKVSSNNNNNKRVLPGHSI